MLLLVLPGLQSIPQDRRDDRRLTREGWRFRHRLLQELDDFLEEEDCLPDGGGGHLEEDWLPDGGGGHWEEDWLPDGGGDHLEEDWQPDGGGGHLEEYC